MEISEENRECISKFLNDTGIPKEAFMADMEKEYEVTKNEEQALINTKSAYQREMGNIPKKAIFFKGVVLGWDDLQDSVELIRRKAKKAYDQNLDKAVSDGLCDADGTPLDTRKNVNFGKPNPKLGLPIEGSNYFRNMYFYVSKMEEDSYMVLRSTLGEKTAESFVKGVERFKPCTFRAIDRVISKTNEKVLNMSKFTKFEPTDLNVEELLDNLPITPVSEIESWHEIYKDDKARFLITKGYVVDINREVTEERRSRMVMISAKDTTEIYTCFVSPEMPLDFGNNTTVLVTGRTNKRKDFISINAIGIYPYETGRTMP